MHLLNLSRAGTNNVLADFKCPFFILRQHWFRNGEMRNLCSKVSLLLQTVNPVASYTNLTLRQGGQPHQPKPHEKSPHP